jgi:D-alanyl-D-alanine carboxypeptidase/D-alanyl-D-alanine-endopeptidase (penicillin-binding protein 4)
VEVRKSADAGRTPSGAVELARVESAPSSRLAKLTNLQSDNWFAEELAKGLPGSHGTTTGGARVVVDFASSRGASAHLVDGSGLSHSNTAAPHSLVRYLVKERSEPEGSALFGSLPIAGESGTLAQRMRSGAAHRHCRGKTGTLRGVSTLSGYCHSKSGHLLFFSILMNGQSSTSRAQGIQDRMVQAIASYEP